MLRDPFKTKFKKGTKEIINALSQQHFKSALSDYEILNPMYQKCITTAQSNNHCILYK